MRLKSEIKSTERKECRSKWCGLATLVAILVAGGLTSCGGDQDATPTSSSNAREYLIGSIQLGPVLPWTAGVPSSLLVGSGNNDSNAYIALSFGSTAAFSPYPNLGPVPSERTASLNGNVFGLQVFSNKFGWTGAKTLVSTPTFGYWPHVVQRTSELSATPDQIVIGGRNPTTGLDEVWTASLEGSGTTLPPAKLAYSMLEADSRLDWTTRFASRAGETVLVYGIYKDAGPTVRRVELKSNGTSLVSEYAFPLNPPHSLSYDKTQARRSTYVGGMLVTPSLEVLNVSASQSRVAGASSERKVPPIDSIPISLLYETYVRARGSASYVPLSAAVEAARPSSPCKDSTAFGSLGNVEVDDGYGGFAIQEDGSLTLRSGGWDQIWLRIEPSGSLTRLLVETCQSYDNAPHRITAARVLSDSTKLVVRAATGANVTPANKTLSITENGTEVSWATPLPKELTSCTTTPNPAEQRCAIETLATKGSEAILVFSHALGYSRIQPRLNVASRSSAGRWSYIGAADLVSAIPGANECKLHGIKYIGDAFYAFGECYPGLGNSHQFAFRVGSK